MSVAFRQVRFYLRVVAVSVAALAIALVLIKNRNHEVRFWFFGLTDDQRPMNVIYLMLCTASMTLMASRVGSAGRRLWRDMRELKRAEVIGATDIALDDPVKEGNEPSRRLDVRVRP